VGGHGLVQEQHARRARQRTCERDALPLTARQLGRFCLCEPVDAETPEQPVRPAAAEGDVLLDRQVRKERVLLEDVTDRPLLRPPVDPPLCVEPDLLAAGDPAALGTGKTREGTQDRGFPGTRRAEKGERLRPDLERELYVEGAKREREIEAKRNHGKSFRATRRIAPRTMKSALIASAVSKS
jgi:hypothetical protein